MSRRPRGSSWASALLVLALVPMLLAPPAQAGTGRVTLTVARTSVTVGATVAVSGQVTPKAAGITVLLQRKVGKAWVSVGHASSTPAGRYTVKVRAPAKAVTWLLRAFASSGAVSRSVSLHVLRSKLAVHASAPPTVVAGAPVVVRGSVSPKATGTVVLQESVRGRWTKVATATLTRTSSFVISRVQPLGQHVYRVIKPVTPRTGLAVSSPLHVAVVTALSVTTASLPAGTAGLPYAVHLVAAGGTAPYRWSLLHGGLPAGVALSVDGALTGTPTGTGSATLTTVVSDGSGQTATRALILTVALSPVARQTVVGWGRNSDGELGNGTTSSSTIAVPVPGLAGVTAIAGGGAHGYALRFDGSVWAWGYNHYGQLGDGSTTDRLLPVRVAGLTDVTAIAGGGYSGYALRSDGTVWSWGYNHYGELGNGTAIDSAVPVQVAGLTGVTAIGAGLFSAYAVRSDGSAWAWGQGGDGELGDGLLTNSPVPVHIPGLSQVVAITGSDENGYALTSAGTVWSWGVNDFGQVGDGTTTDRATPVQVTALTGVTRIAAAVSTGFAVTSTGSVYSWGDNGDGQLGDGTMTDRHSPVLLGLSGATGVAAGANDAGYALRFDGTVSAWGSNGHGALGDGTSTNHYLPAPVDGLTGVVAIAGGNVVGFGLAIVSG